MPPQSSPVLDDPNAWIGEVGGKEELAYLEEQNRLLKAALGSQATNRD
ncbi:hypothetical protein HFN63_32800 [Rhizobium leguminosarum]|nr:hypothetical protein [Rhizobium leguminosarum]MBY5774816.1 hypothetical protein [Rhizobium leguminosarum]